MYRVFEELMKKRGVTAYRVAKETGVPQATLSDWRRGRSCPKIDKLLKIAEYFGVDVGVFIADKTA